MLEVEQAQMNAEAQARLSELRTQLGLGTPPTAPATAPPNDATAAPTEAGGAPAS
jgi:hypothetical protein